MKDCNSQEFGGSLIEYVLLLALILLVAIAAVQSFSGSVSGQFSTIDGALDGVHF